MRRDRPNEVLHYTEREEYKEWKRGRKIAFFENVVFVLLIIMLVTLSFYLGNLTERHFGLERDVKIQFVEKDKR